MRILVVSDIHANLVALESVLADAGEIDEVWNLGDTVGYGPRPRECIARTQSINAAPALAGNHDLAAVARIELSSFNPTARIAAEWTGQHLDAAQRTYIESLPSIVEHGDVTLAHGSPRSPVWEYVTTDDVANENFDYFSSPVCLIGHSHVACYAERKTDTTSAELYLMGDRTVLDLSVGRWLINPGSVGQPRDRDPRAAYAVIETDRATLTGHRVPYDVAATQRQMAAVDLPESLIRRLTFGI
ncbi:MAG: metallophosphoesterase family protein [Thermomicrobiales bacterium]